MRTRYLIYLFYILTVCCAGWHATALTMPPTVTAIEASHSGDTTSFVIELNQPLDLKPSMMGEAVVVNLPDDMVWHAPTSLDSPTGRIQNFSIQSGELVIHLEQNTAMKEVLYQETNGIPEVVLTFEKGNAQQSYEFVRHIENQLDVTTPVLTQAPAIENIRVGVHGPHKTRIVFDSQEPLTLTPTIKDDQLHITTGSQINISPDTIPRKGHIQEVAFASSQAGAHISFALPPGTTVENAFALKSATPGSPHRFVIDLHISQTFTKTDDASTPPIDTSKNDASQTPTHMPTDSNVHTSTSPATPKQPVLRLTNKSGHKSLQTSNTHSSSTPETATPADQKVTSFTLTLANDTTRLIIGTLKPQHFQVIENEHTRQVQIKLPKTNWSKVTVQEDEMTMVKSYFVDQSHPAWTTLVLTLYPDTSVLNQEVIYTYHDHPSFALTFGPPNMATPIWAENKIYHWGRNIKIADTDTVVTQIGNQPLRANTQETVVQKNPFAFETEKPEYNKGDPFQGGTANYTNIGTGPYIGAQVAYVTGRNKVRSTKGALADFTTNQSLDGFNVGVYAGYGYGIDRFVIGAEAFMNLAYQSGRHTVQANAAAPILTFKDTTSYSYGAAAKFGMYVAPETMLSMRLGVTGTILNHKVSPQAKGVYGVSKNIKQNMAGILYGIGMESALTDQLSLRLDFNHIDYQHFTKSFVIDSATQTGRFAPKVQQVLVGITYQFDYMFGPNSNVGIGSIPTGFYMGTGLDMSSMSFNRSLKTVTSHQYHMKSNVLTPTWTLHMGYGVQYGKYYYGIEADATLGTRILKEEFMQGGAGENSILQMQPSFGIYFRPGLTFGHGNLFYAKLGVVSSRLKKKGTSSPISPTFTHNGTRHKTLVGLALGGGIEAFSSDHLSIRGEYIYEVYQKMTMALGNSLEKVSPTNSKFQLTINYLF